MRARRTRLQHALKPGEIAPTVVAFPLMGVGDFTGTGASVRGLVLHHTALHRTVAQCAIPHMRNSTHVQERTRRTHPAQSHTRQNHTMQRNEGCSCFTPVQLAASSAASCCCPLPVANSPNCADVAGSMLMTPMLLQASCKLPFRTRLYYQSTPQVWDVDCEHQKTTRHVHSSQCRCRLTL